MSRFYITGLPRSRTKWFSAFFMSDDIYCHHEALNGCHSDNDFEDRMSLPFSYVGNSDSSLLLKPELIDGPCVVIERNPGDVIASAKRIFGDDEKIDEVIFDLYSRVKSVPGLHIAYEDINDRLDEIWSHCVGIPFSQDRANALVGLNIQSDDFSVDIKSYKFLRG